MSNTIRDDFCSCIINECYESDHEQKIRNGQNVYRACLKGAILSNLDLTGQDLRNSCLVETDLTNTIIDKNLVYGSDLRNAINGEIYGDTKNYPGRITTINNISILQSYEPKNSSVKIKKIKGIKNIQLTNFITGLFYESYGTNDKHIQLALDFYKKAENYPPALNNLGYMYEHGYGVEKNLNIALKYYERAAVENSIAKFNLLRLHSGIIDFDPVAAYGLASKYREGSFTIGIPADHKLAFYWYKKSAKHEEPYYKAFRYVGMMYRSGTGTKRNLKKADKYLKKGAETNDPEAQFEYAALLELQCKYKDARSWYDKCASKFDHYECFIRLGKLYEEGLGGPKSFVNATNCYKLAAVQDRISGLFNYARMLEHSSDNEENAKLAFDILNKILEKDPEHTGALYLLGTHYQRGCGVKKDVNKGASYFKETAKRGHTASLIRASLTMPFHQSDASGTQHKRILEIRRRVQKAKARIKNEIESLQNEKIIFEDCKIILENFLQNSKEEINLNNELSTSIINPLHLPFDPYLEDILVFDIFASDYPKGKFKECVVNIIHGANSDPSFTQNMIFELKEIFDKIKMQKVNKNRFINLYNLWLTHDPTCISVSDVQLKNGIIARKLIQNAGRCSDGISLFFTDEEFAIALNCSSDDIPIGKRISFALVKYKLQFLKSHIKPNPKTNREHEVFVESYASLLQLMRLPLGIPVPKSFLAHSSIGNEFDHKEVLHRFLYGGKCLYDDFPDFLPFTIPNIIQYLLNIIDDPKDKLLTIGHITAFTLVDDVLFSAAEKGFVDTIENTYINPFSENNPYTEATIERILAIHGYILDGSFTFKDTTDS